MNYWTKEFKKDEFKKDVMQAVLFETPMDAIVNLANKFPNCNHYSIKCENEIIEIQLGDEKIEITVLGGMPSCEEFTVLNN